MARIKPNKDPWHRLTIRADQPNGELLLVAGGRRSYLWAGRTPPEQGCVTISGCETLRRLATAILREIGPKK